MAVTHTSAVEEPYFGNILPTTAGFPHM